VVRHVTPAGDGDHRYIGDSDRLFRRDPADQLRGYLDSEADLATRVGVVDDLRQSSGVAAVQTGQYGGLHRCLCAEEFDREQGCDRRHLRGGLWEASSNYGQFEHWRCGLELYRGPNSTLYGTDAGASVVSLNTPRGSSLRPCSTTRAMRELPHLP